MELIHCVLRKIYFFFKLQKPHHFTQKNCLATVKQILFQLVHYSKLTRNSFLNKHIGLASTETEKRTILILFIGCPKVIHTVYTYLSVINLIIGRTGSTYPKFPLASVYLIWFLKFSFWACNAPNKEPCFLSYRVFAGQLPAFVTAVNRPWQFAVWILILYQYAYACIYIYIYQISHSRNTD